ncbi:MAG: hypothetical protein ABR987_18075 [Terracidiphilus sp.]|jgi:hypothetical protein
MANEPKKTSTEYQLIGLSEDGKVNNLLSELNTKEGRQRLQALIAEWLPMENLVILTGAGTSVSSGGKAMNSLENAVLTTVKAFPKIPSSVSAIIDARMTASPDASSTPKLSFEDWLRAGTANSDRGISGGSVLRQPKMAEKRRADE